MKSGPIGVGWIGSCIKNQMSEGWHISKSVPISIILFLVAQTVVIIIWAVRLDSRVSYVEVVHMEDARRISVLESLLPKLAVIEARQNDVIKRLDGNATKLDQLLNK